MPAVRESSGETPEPLQVVEIRPGVWLKLNAADRAMYETHTADAAEANARWVEANRANVTETTIAGPAVDGPIDDSTEAPDADEAVVVAAPRPKRTRSA